MLPNRPKIIFCTYQNVVKSLGDLGLFKTILYCTARRIVYGSSEAAHAVAPGAVRFLRQTGFSKQIFQLPSIGHGQAVCATLDAGSVRRTRPTTIGYLGRLAPEKGVGLLLKACDKLRFPLLIAGSGPEEERLRRIVCDCKLEECVQFVGRLSHAAVSDFYSQVDILAVPSRPYCQWAEQYGRVLVEAMAHGVVPVGSTCGEIPYVIGDAGLVFECNDAGALQHCLQRLLESPRLLDAFRTKSMRRAQSVFSDERVAEGLLWMFKWAFGQEHTETPVLELGLQREVSS
jgi:glycosyltransferase involved in cell wall biosynthesis